MFEYITVQEAAKLWKISERRVQKLCEENRIDDINALAVCGLFPKMQKNLLKAGEKLINSGEYNGI